MNLVSPHHQYDSAGGIKIEVFATHKFVLSLQAPTFIAVVAIFAPECSSCVIVAFV